MKRLDMKRLLTVFIIILILSFSRQALSQGSEKDTLSISIEEARLIAINNNLEIKLAGLDSRIKDTELGYKEAVFDTILNGEIDYTDDQRTPVSSLYGTKNLTNHYNIGLNKKLTSGTDINIDFTNKREWTDSPYVSMNPYHESQLEINLTQPIGKNFFGLIDRGNIELVKWEIKNAKLDSYIKIENAMISAEKAYWELVLARKEFNIKKEMLKKAIRLFNQYRKELKIGLVETGDVLAAEANMHVRSSELLMASNNEKTAEENLALELNLGSETRLFPTESFPGLVFNTSLIESMRKAFEYRRDYISAKNDIERTKVKLRMKTSSRFPEIDLKATFARNGIDSKYYRAIEDIPGDSNREYSIGIEFKYPLENNAARSGYEKARLEKARAIINLGKVERGIVSNIEERFRDVCVNKLNISHMKRIENLQKGKLHLEEQRFKYGRTNSYTLISYQEDLLKAELATQKAYFNYTVSIVELMGAEDSYLKNIGLD